MRWVLYVFAIVVLGSFAAQAQNRADTLVVVNWNLEWWGSGSPLNASQQVSRTQSLISSIGADIYAMEEIVNTDSFANMVGRLPGGPWSYVISQYGSLATSPSSSKYASAQKLALLYRTSVLRNVSARAFLKANSYAYDDFASGRYPFLVQGEVRGRDSIWRPLSFIVLHAKADGDASSCSRREDGNYIMKDTLDNRMPNERFLLLGDFNDDLIGTICTGATTSTYASFVADTTDAVSYRCLTLPLSRAGEYSIDGYSHLIDHVIASDEMAQAYVKGSARSLRTFVKGIYSNYAYTVSDHYPIQTKYVLDAGTLAVADATPISSHFRVVPNPASGTITIQGAGTLSRWTVLDATGRVVLNGSASGFPVQLNISSLAPGAYVVQAIKADGTVESQLLIHQP
jgi:hypothetical protein